MGYPALKVTSPRDELAMVAADAEVADVALAASGDAHAFERLYRAHVARVHGLARRMIGHEEADELTQDVFVRAWQKLGTFRGESQFGTWLHRLAINVLLAKRGALGTARARFDDSEGTFDDLRARPGSPELAMDFETALQRLPAGARQVFVLHDMQGYKHEEIGTMLDISPGTSKAQLHRARMMLRKHLTR
jgi:RNA polymerase sigma-70 factor (ECF subfamily)